MRYLVMLGVCLVPAVAHAGWLEDSWSEETTSRIGSPAITIRGDGSVGVVLQHEMLARTGLDASGAVKAFLEHYGPRQCSDLLDLNVAHKSLRIDVYVERSDGTQSTVAAGPVSVTIDYVPARPVSCVYPDVDYVS